MVIFDPRDIAHNKTLSYVYTGGKQQVLYDGIILDPKSIWFRKPRTVDADMLDIDPQFHDYALGSLQQHTMALLTAFDDALWVSDFYALRRASDKPHQIGLAQKLGFAVPDTLFTSDATEAKAFIGNYETTILKPVVPFFETSGEGLKKSLFSTKVSSKKLPDLSGLHQTPVIFQQAIDAAYDVRVSVVGDKVFAARVVYKGDDNSGVRDWRLGHYEGELSIVPDDKFPKDIEQKCVEHVSRLGLNFGAIDLVVDKKGIYWFLENNPNGQWAFVEKETGQPIGKALAEMLMVGKRT